MVHRIDIHHDRRLGRSVSPWVRSFACDDLRPLIVCRGPVRKETLDVFDEMGMKQVGILLSEKDSIVYPNALAPELKVVHPDRVHRISDYSGATAEERRARMKEIVRIAKTNDYNAVFAGYGFMAEDADFVKTIEEAGLMFVGPCSYTQRAAGQKDEAKNTAQVVNVSTTPGVDDLEIRAVKARFPHPDALLAASQKLNLPIPPERFAANDVNSLVREVLDASRSAHVDVVSIDEIAAQLQTEVVDLLRHHPGRRIRIKAVGSGGGKGQRIIPAPPRDDDESRAEAGRKGAELFREVLSEVKATGPGDNKNVLLELNIETTRHHEIQLVGNGSWCIALGGRDCSLQMHEQKLLEISITQEGLKSEIISARNQGHEAVADALTQDLVVLERMEAEAERFGEAVKLDSASTFECIVDGAEHYFMEMNTRIQVEHRVSELCYRLRFTNPDDPEDYFEIDSLIEAMALVARHKERLPRPTRQPRFGAAIEARLNATDGSLSPHAGGVIINWSKPLPYEVRDDQGISLTNPDTDRMVRYRLAGAYDSNIALLVTAADDRTQSMEQLREILRVTKMRGHNLATNLEFHYGLVNWLLRNHPYAKASTAFMKPYLSQVGLLGSCAAEIDLDQAELLIERRLRTLDGAAATAAAEALALKKTLIRRPIDMLMDNPHMLAGWLAEHARDFDFAPEGFRWRRNPVDVLADTYFFMNMENRSELPAAHCIWDHDDEILKAGQAFYRALEERLGVSDWSEIRSVLERDDPPSQTFDEATWGACRAAHRGHQIGMELLGLLAVMGKETGFFELTTGPDLQVVYPPRLKESDIFDRMKRVLSPPPMTKADEIVAVTGGMYYSKESPERPPLVEKGSHFEKGQPIYVIEVMKMFNKVPAPFSGTVDEVLMDKDGTVVAKGQPLFKVTPDEKVELEDPVEVARRRRLRTEALLPAPSIRLD
ncbi:MAG: biotin/lipoyl-containing protein [Myxococcota bacterium]